MSSSHPYCSVRVSYCTFYQLCWPKHVPFRHDDIFFETMCQRYISPITYKIIWKKYIRFVRSLIVHFEAAILFEYKCVNGLKFYLFIFTGNAYRSPMRGKNVSCCSLRILKYSLLQYFSDRALTIIIKENFFKKP